MCLVRMPNMNVTAEEGALFEYMRHNDGES